MSNIDQAEAAALSNASKQAEIRAFNTNAPIPGAVEVDPLEVQLIAHFRTLSAYGKRVAVHQMAAAATLCAGLRKEG